ncbi:hypothetical protein FC88_GL002301 [Companilactobacillus futsaii JCM 17355]|uniref:Uncharacterized protein n=1 Tax=Companilactobacillus futsaii JCM 17355 TaxID=1423818 RepID=A0ABR5P711_9LACO|nr:hypothetical protein FC88_GL002301 [Companilactobacillus futsaii JCM 17355]
MYPVTIDKTTTGIDHLWGGLSSKINGINGFSGQKIKWYFFWYHLHKIPLIKLV